MGKYGDFDVPKGGGDGLFVKLNSGESIEFLVSKDAKPFRRMKEWDGVTRPRVLFPIYVIAADDMKIFEMAPSTWHDLAARLDHERVGGHRQVYELARQGAGKDTKWSITRIEEADATKLDRVAKLPLPDMGRYGEPIGKGGGGGATPAHPGPAASTDDDIPF